MTSPPSPSERPPADGDGRASSAFGQLHPQIQHWIWRERWTELRDAQERAAAPILAADRDVVIAAATASGKTEAAFLPICSALLDTPQPGVKALYVSPLKALINDQYLRLDLLCEHLDLPVHRWHGDVAASRKAKVLSKPDGLLLITPESLEALLIRHGHRIGHLFAGLRYVVIDEMHAFLGVERGAQLQSLLHRVELAIRRRVPRVGLSATLGDMTAAAEYLRPGHGGTVTVIVAADDTHELRMQLRGYEATHAVATPGADATDEPAPEEDDDGAQSAIADHLFATLRGSDNLIFANSRRDVEIYADLLSRRSEAARVPNEFVPHHGNLSKELREHVEARLKARDVPVNAVCTSTLEMGIDIGSVASIAQIGAPHSVSSLRQRLGRSGRRGGPATLRLYIIEAEVTAKTPPQNALRVGLVQSIAMINLLLQRWNEPPDINGLHLSTLTQQVLSLIAQHGGVTGAEAHQALCTNGPFARVTPNLFARLLRALGAADLIVQAGDGLLLLGLVGERLVNHHTFYAAFRVDPEYRLISAGRTLGSIPLQYPLMPGSLLIFGGRRWKVVAVDDRAKVIELIRSSGGRPPDFFGYGGEVADRVRQEMLTIYSTADVPSYLNAPAARLLAEGRENFARFGLTDSSLLPWGNDTLIFPWRGDRIISTLAIALTNPRADVAQDGICLTMTNTSHAATIERLHALATAGIPDPSALAPKVQNKITEKYHEFLTDELLNIDYAARSLDTEGAQITLKELLSRLQDD